MCTLTFWVIMTNIVPRITMHDEERENMKLFELMSITTTKKVLQTENKHHRPIRF